MDEDLEKVATLLARPAPSPDARDAGLRRLEDAIHRAESGPARHGRRGTWWTVAAVAMSAAVICVGHVVSAARHQATSPPAAIKQSHSVEGLRSAAVSAARQPTRPGGTYWYVRYSVTAPGRSPKTTEIWIRSDGSALIRQRPGGPLVISPQPLGLWPAAGPTVSLAQITHLPTSPGALEHWVTQLIMRLSTLSDGGSVPRTPPNVPRTPPNMNAAPLLVDLLWEAPAPPLVRAAAFEALAALKPSSPQIVTDPRTSQVRAIREGPAGTLTVQAARWTNILTSPPHAKKAK